MLDPRRIGIMGFSAGGHLATLAENTFDPATRPDFAVLGYPAYIGADTVVAKNAPPTFIFVNDDDRFATGAGEYYLALRKAKISAEFHVFRRGGHGVGATGRTPELEKLGAELVDVKFPSAEYGLSVYYVIMPCEVSANLSRYDGVRYGHRDMNSTSLSDLYPNSRSEFGAEVKRRIMLGVYALSSGYYDAYYKKAQQVRRLIADDFSTAFNKCDLILSPTAPATAFEFGSKSADPLEMYLEDIMTVTVNLAGLPGISINCGYDSKGLPIGMQLIAPALEESRIYNAAYAFESTTDFSKAPRLQSTINA